MFKLIPGPLELKTDMIISSKLLHHGFSGAKAHLKWI